MSAPLSRKNLPENPSPDDILNTPTGSGKSLVALALQFKSLCQGRRSYYTVPIKALANEKTPEPLRVILASLRAAEG